MALKDPHVFHWEKRPFDPGRSYKGKSERWVPYEKNRAKTKGTGWGTWLDAHGYNADATRELKQPFGKKIFETPKPTQLFQWLISLHSNLDAIVLDCFAGSATTGHAVLLQNQEDGGNRKFVLAQMPETIAKDKPAYDLGFREVVDVTAERMRRVISGYKFSGVLTEELLRERVNFSMLKKFDAWADRISQIEFLDGNRFDEITKTVEKDELHVIGTKVITQKVDGLGGSFTFADLGPEMSLDKLLADGLPTFEALAKYVFFTATGRTLSELPKQKSAGPGFIGETDLYRVHLLYKQDKKWLQSNDSALTEKLADEIIATNPERKKLLVFAAAKFMSQRDLSRRGVDFCQLPYAIHRVLGD